jgi:hypothetical protein
MHEDGWLLVGAAAYLGLMLVSLLAPPSWLPPMGGP